MKSAGNPSAQSGDAGGDEDLAAERGDADLKSKPGSSVVTMLPFVAWCPSRQTKTESSRVEQSPVKS